MVFGLVWRKLVSWSDDSPPLQWLSILTKDLIKTISASEGRFSRNAVLYFCITWSESSIAIYNNFFPFSEPLKTLWMQHWTISWRVLHLCAMVLDSSSTVVLFLICRSLFGWTSSFCASLPSYAYNPLLFSPISSLRIWALILLSF